MSKYIDPLVDFSFKKLFGSESSKDIMISMLNSILKGQKIIRDIVYNKNEHVGDHKERGTVIFDLLCTSDDNIHFLIEVQRSLQQNFIKRMRYYGSKLITDQAPKGRRKHWNYQLQQVYVIVLMDGFTLFKNSFNYYHTVGLCELETGHRFDEEYLYIYLELDYFNKQPIELETHLDYWLFVLKNLTKLEEKPHFLTDAVFEKVFDLAEFTNLSEKEQMMYESDLKRMWDNRNALDYAENQGIKRGLEVGLEQGLNQGIEQGLNQGIEQGLELGRNELSKEIVQKLVRKGIYSDQEIAQIMDVTLAYIEEIRKEIAESDE